MTLREALQEELANAIYQANISEIIFLHSAYVVMLNILRLK